MDLKRILPYVKVLNEHATLILVIITAILVIITAEYACYTHRMSKLMEKQVVSDIQVDNIQIRSDFFEKWFVESLEKQPEQINKKSCFEFNLFFDVRNRSSGSGSIDKPTLILEFTNNNFKYEVPPSTRKEDWINISKTQKEIRITDLGGTIFLRGGESQKIKLEYMLLELTDDSIKHIRENINSLEYYIKFRDNLGKNYSFKIDKVRGKTE